MTKEQDLKKLKKQFKRNCKKIVALERKAVRNMPKELIIKYLDKKSADEYIRVNYGVFKIK